MIEVLSSFECTTNTFFVAVDLMDRYLQKRATGLEPHSIHLIGVTSMLVASKIEEITPFKVSVAVDKMAHGKLTAKEIVQCEIDFAIALDYRLMANSSLFVFVEMALVKLNLHSNAVWKDALKVATYIAKMTMHDYKLLTKHSIEYLGCGCIYLCFKIIEQARPTFNLKHYLDEIKETFDLNELNFYRVSEDLLELAKAFEQTYSFAKNLLKYDSFSLDRCE